MIAGLIGALIALAAWHLATDLLIPRLRRRSTRPPERLEECTCGAEIPVSKAHIVSSVDHDPETGGGTVASAAFCRAHCPGGCNHLKEHR